MYCVRSALAHDGTARIWEVKFPSGRTADQCLLPVLHRIPLVDGGTIALPSSMMCRAITGLFLGHHRGVENQHDHMHKADRLKRVADRELFNLSLTRALRRARRVDQLNRQVVHPFDGYRVRVMPGCGP